MHPALYKAAHHGNVQSLKGLIEKDRTILHSVTPKGNTALHIAAWLGHKEFVEEILRQSGTIIVTKNAEDDTPLHVAARAGHLDIVVSLINYSLEWTTMTNKAANTPLHEAVSHRNSEIAMKLLNAEPSVRYEINLKEESPLDIAAREGLASVVQEILKKPVEGLEQQPPLSGTRTSPLHQAVLGGHISIVEILLKERSDLIKVTDASGNNALHCAAQKNSGKMVEILLRVEPSLPYMTNLEGSSPLHVAAAYDSVIVIKELLLRCPDTTEQVDCMGMNAFHIAVMNKAVKSLMCLLKNIQPKEIINQVDASGNTPLHLAVKHSRIQSSLLLLKDKRVDPGIVNTDGLTARKIIESLDQLDTHEKYIWKVLKKREAQKCKKPQFTEAGISRSSRKKLSTTDEPFKASAETYTLVTVLIATVAFSAAITMPGGYNQRTGMAILAKHAAFKAFVISNTIAMCSSLVVVFCFIWAWKDPVRFKLNQLTWGHRLTVVACLAMLVTFITAVYQVVADECLWLAIVVCLICSSAPFIVCIILGPEVLFIPL